MAAAATTSRRILALAVVCLQSASAAAEGTRYTVGGPDGWRVPPPEDKERYYANWASNITFYVDDSIEFVYRNDSVIKVGKAGFYHCNETAPDAAPRDGTTLFVLDAPGPTYFASADLGHCSMGERLMIDVLAAQPPAPSPWSSAAPGPWSWVLSPPSSAPASAGPSPVQHSAAASAPLVATSFSARAAAVLAPVALALAAAGFI
ncbi:hypothetical protein BAE44_0025769 [Dichanthelium oligosanthes]|uniref:Phytocyanin domain-containing protein n=1 Tax=Dichanthelium oligosanthes TaxID=888268 RepID=A0A1E5UJZ6_9POAL|nr:hypothetical protein BAE44_0025769 [Dichanthelium oligosanthes]